MIEFNDGFFWRRTFWLIQGPENSYQVQFQQNLMNGFREKFKYFDFEYKNTPFIPF